eukprot:1396291-Prymnesium_polylepis.1
MSSNVGITHLVADSTCFDKSVCKCMQVWGKRMLVGQDTLLGVRRYALCRHGTGMQDGRCPIRTSRHVSPDQCVGVCKCCGTASLGWGFAAACDAEMRLQSRRVRRMVRRMRRMGSGRGHWVAATIWRGKRDRRRSGISRGLSAGTDSEHRRMACVAVGWEGSGSMSSRGQECSGTVG